MEGMLKVQILADSLELQAAVDSSRQPFTAIITYAGKVSEGFVGGSENIKGGPYRVLIPVELLQKKISLLAGKRVFASSELNTHKSSKFVGEFTDAWCEEISAGVVAGKASGFFYRNADPDLVNEIVQRSRKGEMGFSYDIKDVRFELTASKDSSDPQYMCLTDFQWRGATVLARDTAAYLETELAAQKIKSKQEGEDEMTKEEIMAAVSAGMEPALKSFQSEVINPLKTELSASISEVKNEVAELRGKHDQLEASITPNPKAQPPKQESVTPPKSDSNPPVQKLSASDFVASMSASMAEAIGEIVKPLQETVESLKEALTEKQQEDPAKGFRKTLSAQDVGILSKYGDLEDSAEPTVSNYQSAIAMIQNDAHMSKEQKGSIIANLRAQKNQLIRIGGN